MLAQKSFAQFSSRNAGVDVVGRLRLCEETNYLPENLLGPGPFLAPIYTLARLESAMPSR